MPFTPVLTREEYMNEISKIIYDANMEGLRGRRLVRVFWNNEEDCVSAEFQDCMGVVIADEPDLGCSLNSEHTG